MKLVYMFPGQNSRYPQMIAQLRSLTPIAEDVLDEASDVLSRDLRAHFLPENAGMFDCNRDVQVGVFLASHILLKALEAEGIQAEASAGLSLGEYNHLVHTGALRFDDALPLLVARGDAYDHAPQGRMMSVFPCDVQQVESALEGSVDIGIQLTKRHFVLSGEHSAVEAAAARVEEEAYAQVRVIDSRLPMHSRIFRPAAEEFRSALDRVHWQAPKLPYAPNVDGCLVASPTADIIVDRLYRHVFTRVRWSHVVGAMVERFPGAAFVELGPKSVLHDLFSREYRNVRSFHTDDAEGGFAAFRPVVDALRNVRARGASDVA
jgi:[acyl-carrier-protein] S-malonyltransferase